MTDGYRDESDETDQVDQADQHGQVDEVEQPAGYDYGRVGVARSPVRLQELDELVHTAGITAVDRHYLELAGEVLRDQAAQLVDAWRSMLGEHPYLAACSAHPDGTPNPEYSAASHPRFARWIVDVCTRPFDQDWLDYQEEIGLRHTSSKKNLTDHADSVDHVPLRYLIAFAGPLIVSTRPFLRARGHCDDDVARMHEAWTKSVLLHLTLWTRPYSKAGAW